MQQYYTFDQLVEQLPEICKEQRRFLQLTQADVVERLEKETGVRKDQSKISMFESGKIAIPDFLSDYCSILDIRFPAPSYRKEYLMEKKDVTKKLDAKEMNAEKITFIKKVVKETMRDMGYKIDECENNDIYSIGKYHCVKASIPIVSTDAVSYLTNNFIFIFTEDEDTPKLCGRMEIYSIRPVAYMNHFTESEMMLYLDKKSADLVEIEQYLQNMVKEYMLEFRKAKMEKQNNNFDAITKMLFNRLWSHKIFIVEDVYVYKEDRKKECFLSMMRSLEQWFGGIENSTWACNIFPIYLQDNNGKYTEISISPKDPDTACLLRENLDKKMGRIFLIYTSNKKWFIHKGKF